MTHASTIDLVRTTVSVGEDGARISSIRPGMAHGGSTANQTGRPW